MKTREGNAAQRSGSRILVVDDDEGVLRAHSRALKSAGYEVESALSGDAAMRALENAPFEVILSDVDMPGMNGIRLLEKVRARDLDVPVIMITGGPSVETAAAAIEHGALRYLLKPIAMKELVQVVDDACRLHRLSKAKRLALELAGGVDRFVGDRAGLSASFDRALETAFMAFQPIVSWSKKTLFAHEALLRSREAALPHPGAMLDAAERLGRVHDLGRRVRAMAVEPLAQLADDISLFVNLHPADLADEQLFDPRAPLSVVAKRVVLEITERAPLDELGDVRARVEKLRALGFRIAIDDLGAGYAGLTSFALLEPDVVKLDMGLVRDLHLSTTKQTLVRTMIAMSGELGITVTGEGIETAEERDALANAGCDLMQGYLFARPGPPFVTPQL